MPTLPKRAQLFSRGPTFADYRARPPHPQRKSGGKRPRLESDNNTPLVSLVTICRNAATTLPRTLDSVRAQTYPNIEYIVVDGASTDETLDILRANEDIITLWISEPDRDISEAVNKALSMATGEIIIQLWSDDWLEKDFSQISVDTLNIHNVDFIYGDLLASKDGKIEFLAKSSADYASKISYMFPIRTPSLTVTKNFLNTVGPYSEIISVSNDYEWLLRAHTIGLSGIYEPKLIVHYSLCGWSSNNFLTGLWQAFYVAWVYNGPKTKIIQSYMNFLFRHLAKTALAKFLSPGTMKALKSALQRT